MRRLVEPSVLKHATLAAVVTALACYPRFLLWDKRVVPVWFLEVVIFVTSIVLWSFVFAWHTTYGNRPFWVSKPGLKWFFATTVAALVAGAVSHVFFDPPLRSIAPDDFPPDLSHWFADLLFAVAFNQLFLVYAPFAWSIRLFRRQTMAAVLTVFFGLFILVNKLSTYAAPISPSLYLALLIGKIISGILVITFYLRGGWLLASWWMVLVETRYLFDVK